MLPSQQNARFHNLFSILVGMAIPMMMFGRAVFAVVAIMAFTVLLVSDLRGAAWRQLVRSVRQPLGIAAVTTLLFWVASSLGSSFPIRSLEATLRTGLFVAMAVMIHGGLRAMPMLGALSLKAFVLAAAVTAAIALLSETVLPELYWALRLKGWNPTPLTIEMKSFSSLAVILVPLLFLSLREKTIPWRALIGFAIAVMGFLVWETYNRSAIAGFLGIGIALAVTWFTRRGTRMHIALTMASLVGVFVLVFEWLRYSRNSTASMAPVADWLFPVWLIDFQRQTMWGYALDIAWQAPWLGVGANTINYSPGADTPLPGNENLHIIPAHPHNWLVEVLAETGVLGLAGLTVCISILGLYLLRAFRATGRGGALAAIAIMAGYWVSGLFNFSYWSAWWQVSFVLGLALALTLEPHRHASEEAVHDA